jgi:hypothetical protein
MGVHLDCYPCRQYNKSTEDIPMPERLRVIAKPRNVSLRRKPTELLLVDVIPVEHSDELSKVAIVESIVFESDEQFVAHSTHAGNGANAIEPRKKGLFIAFGKIDYVGSDEGDHRVLPLSHPSLQHRSPHPQSNGKVGPIFLMLRREQSVGESAYMNSIRYALSL